MDGENEGQRDHGTDEVARDHDALAVEAVEEHAGHRTGQHGGDGAGQHDARDHQAGTRTSMTSAKTAMLLK